jgi:CRP-like cAMP-binding protein
MLTTSVRKQQKFLKQMLCPVVSRMDRTRSIAGGARKPALLPVVEPLAVSRLPALDPEHPDQAELIIRRLSQCADLAPEEVELLRSLSETPERLPAGTELIAQGERLEHPRLLLAGWACRQRYLSDGRRQIFDFILPGDLYGLCLRPQAVALCNAVTLTRATVSNASALGDAVITHPDAYPGLTTATLMSASTDEAYLLNQMVRIGRQTAYERVAHLILELHHRLKTVGIATDDYMPLPLTQEIIADALGLSIVHLNRTLQQLRRDGVLEVKGGAGRILDAGKLRNIADFHAPHVSARRIENGSMRLHAMSA